MLFIKSSSLAQTFYRRLENPSTQSLQKQDKPRRATTLYSRLRNTLQPTKTDSSAKAEQKKNEAAELYKVYQAAMAQEKHHPSFLPPEEDTFFQIK